MSRDDGPAGRALVTFSRSWQSLAAVRSLGARGVEVVTGDEISLTPGSLSKYSVDSFVYPNESADPEGFLDALDEAVDRFRPPEGTPYVLLPVHRETYLIARHRDRFESRIALALPPSSVIDRVRDKGRLVELAREAGVATPRTWLPADVEALRGVLDEIELPALVKARTGVAGVGIEKVETRDALLEAFRRLESEGESAEGPPFVQQLVEGDDYCVSALFENGRSRAVLTYRNLRSIAEGAPGAVRRTVEAPVPEEAAVRLLETLDWHGIAEVDFVWSGERDDVAYLIEVNPRLFGGLFQAIASNVDYPWMLYRLALGLPVEPVDEVAVGVTTESPVLGFLATLREAAESASGWSAVERAWSELKEHFERGEPAVALERLVRGPAGEDEVGEEDDRLGALRGLLEERETTISELFAGEDPKAAMGLLYPLLVFLRHGRVSAAALAGAAPLAGGRGADEE